MVFASLLFIYLFLPLNLICVFAAKKTETRNTILLLFSLFFYAFGGPRYLLLLLFMVAVCWMSGMKIEEKRLAGGTGKGVLIVCIVIMLGLLGFFKYTGFLFESLQSLIGASFAIPEWVKGIVLPIGISFYTFQLLSYVIDVCRGEVEAQHSYARLLLYAGLFHQCIAGPIVRYQTVAAELEHRETNVDEIWGGVVRFSVGLAKKAVLANHCAELSDALWPTSQAAIPQASTLALAMSAFYYMLQIYLDFSAYSDMAIGMGRMMGIHYLENFHYPYMADSVTEFWRRWHISLSGFFRDYVYIPLGGNRRGKGRQVFNLFVVWMLTGLWHGANWTFVAWGLYFFVFLMIEKLLIKKPKKASEQTSQSAESATESIQAEENRAVIAEETPAERAVADSVFEIVEMDEIASLDEIVPMDEIPAASVDEIPAASMEETPAAPAEKKVSIAGLITKVLRHAYLLIVVYFGWILFRADSITQAIDVIRGIFGGYGNPLSALSVEIAVKNQVFFIAVAVLAVTPYPAMIAGKVHARLCEKRLYPFFAAMFPALLVLISTMCLVGNSYNPFLYFRF